MRDEHGAMVDTPPAAAIDTSPEATKIGRAHV